jgi:predicted DsbA family dithiol-disulfide isomerase
VTETKPMPLRIDLVSDVVCPWCIIGYLQLSKALAERADKLQLELHWHPFELNPGMPEEGQDLREHMAEKYGASEEQSRGARTRLSDLGSELGFQFNYGADTRMVNTFRAHQLLHWAGEKGCQTELQMALFDAFFTERQDVNDASVLVACAVAVGLPADEATAVMESGKYAEEVRTDQRRWLEEGIQAVPCFVVNQQYMVQGAQDSVAFGRMLDKILAANDGLH